MTSLVRCMCCNSLINLLILVATANCEALNDKAQHMGIDEPVHKLAGISFVIKLNVK